MESNHWQNGPIETGLSVTMFKTRLFFKQRVFDPHCLLFTLELHD